MTDELTRTSWHEAGHGVIARRLGRRVKFLSTVTDQHLAGLTAYYPGWDPKGSDRYFTQPLTLWPLSRRRAAEVDIMVTLAGHIAEWQVPPPPHADLPILSEDELAAEDMSRTLAAQHPRHRDLLDPYYEQDEPRQTDAESTARYAGILVPKEEADAYLHWLSIATGNLVREERRFIEAVALDLRGQTVISGRRMAAVIRKRARMGWRGSE